MLRLLVFVFAFTLVGFTAVSLFLNRGPDPARLSELEPAASGVPAIGGTFTLTDQNGKKVSDADFKGKLMLVFFGFTHCPDICPVTLTTLGNVMKQLGEKSALVVPVLITVDPERDTPQRLKEYLKDFHPATVGLTGTKEEVDAALAAYKAYASKAAVKEGHGGHDEHYLMNHSAFIYLMDANGVYVTHFAQEDTEQKIVSAVSALVK